MSFRSSSLSWRRRSAAVLALVTVAVSGLTTTLTPASAYAAEPTATTVVHKRNLLRAHSFTDHGYASVTTADNWEGEGEFELAACGATRSTDADGYVNEKFRLYQGAHTYGEQVVIQFGSSTAAAAYVLMLRDAVTGCAANTEDAVAYSRVHRPDLAGVSSARWWSSHNDQGWTRSWGTLSVIREGARVSVLTMASVTSKPKDTMDVPALTQDMAVRLDLV